MSAETVRISRPERGLTRGTRSLAAACALVVVGLLPAPPLGSRPLEGRREALALLAEGQEAQRAGRIREAIDCFRQSAELAPSPAAYYNLGLALRKAGQKAPARQAFEKALELSPDYELAKQALAELGAGTSAASAPTNFDAVEAQRETLDSLRKADNEAFSPREPLLLSIGSLLPKPKRLVESAQPSIPKPSRSASQPPAPAARDAVVPAAPVEIVNEVPTREIVSAEVPRERGRGKPATTGREATSSAVKSLRLFSLWQGKKEPPADSRRPSFPSSSGPSSSTGPSAQTASLKNRPVTPGAEAQPAPSPSAAAINEAAFSQEPQTEKSAKRYGNPSKILLGTFEFHREKADAYRKTQRWIEAADEYEKALEKKPDDVETRALLAECLARAGELDVAESQFERALEMDPNDPKVLFRRGNTYRELKKLDRAIEAYRAALGADPNNVAIRNNLGVVYMEKGEYKKAIEEFKKVIALDPSYTNALLNLGIIYDERLGDRQQALRYYKLYVEKNGPRAGEVRRWISELEGK